MKLEITLTRSLIGRKPNHVKTAKALGLHRVGHTVTVNKNDATEGMVNTIIHLVSVREVE